MTPVETINQITTALGIDGAELRRRAMLARWNLARFEQEMHTQGWTDRFAAAVERGQREYEQEQRDEQERNRAHIASRYQRALGGLSALAKYTPAELEALISAPRLKALALSYDIAEHGGRLVLGPTGIGKSVCGARVIRRRVEATYQAAKADDGSGWAFARPSIIWVRALDLPNARLQQAFGKGEVDVVTDAADTEYLVLDDLGWESRRAGADDVIAEVLARRYDQGLTTFATSGLTLPQFRERYSDAIVRRITEAGGKPGKVLDLWQSAALKAV